jgi:hypothetical protein
MNKSTFGVAKALRRQPKDQTRPRKGTTNHHLPFSSLAMMVGRTKGRRARPSAFPAWRLSESLNAQRLSEKEKEKGKRKRTIRRGKGERKKIYFVLQRLRDEATPPQRQRHNNNVIVWPGKSFVVSSTPWLCLSLQSNLVASRGDQGRLKKRKLPDLHEKVDFVELEDLNLAPLHWRTRKTSWTAIGS